MHNFEDELTIESYRVPWLIWIQLIVMVLLFFLIYCFSLLVMDVSEDTTKPSSSSNSRLVNGNHNNTTTTVSTNRFLNTQVAESIKGEIVPSTSRVMRAEDMVEMDSSAASNIHLHPCDYFRLARIAFLKCLGLDSTGENSSTPQRGKRKEN